MSRSVRHPIRESEDLIREHGYLVARGVRPLALIGHFNADPVAMERAATRLEEAVPRWLERCERRRAERAAEREALVEGGAYPEPGSVGRGSDREYVVMPSGEMRRVHVVERE